MSLYGGIEIPGHPDLENIRRLDALPVPMQREMQRCGMAIDPDYFHELEIQFTDENTELIKDILGYVPADKLHEFTDRTEDLEFTEGDASVNPASAEQVCKLLFEILGLGSGKELKKTKTGDMFSTGKKQLELLKKEHPIIQLILDYRERKKLITTYCRALPSVAVLHPRSVGSNYCPICERHHYEDHHRVHTELAGTRARTARFCSRRPNLANIPARTILGSLVRAGFIAAPGCRLTSVDFSQIELRLLAHCARVSAMIEAYLANKDIHIYTACGAFGRDYDTIMALVKKVKKKQATPAEIAQYDHFAQFERAPAKNLNFMIVYGATTMGLLAQLALSGLLWSEVEGDAFIETWFGLYPEVRVFMQEMFYRIRKYGYVWEMFGRTRLAPEIQSTHSWIRNAGMRQSGNFPIQSPSAGQMKITMAMLKDKLDLLRDSGYDIWGLMTIYDQIICEHDEDDDTCAVTMETMKYCFENVMRDVDTGVDMFAVPVKADAECVTRWVKG